MSQETAEGRYGVVYLGAGLDASESARIYQASAPPQARADQDILSPALNRAHMNVRALLDEDQGGFSEVYVCSRTEECMARLESYASSMPTVVLIELAEPVGPGSPVLWNDGQRIEAVPFLRALAADVTGAHYQQRVMPFALLPAESPARERLLDAKMTESCLGAGAIDTVHSPFSADDLNRLIGHVKAMTQPSARTLGAPMSQNLVDSIHSSTMAKLALYRPDECIPAERKEFVTYSIGQWMFPAQELNMDELTYAALQMLERMLSVSDLDAYRISRAELVTFLLATRRQYKHERHVHYHNWRHAVDVTQTIFCFLLAVGLCPRLSQDREARDEDDINALERLLTPLDGLILLISAIGHDVGHPGVNNAFLVACAHPLAQLYNDKSVLENYHCAAYSQLLRRHWPSLSNLPGFRSTMISNILATDMQRHFEYMSYLKDLKRKIDRSQPDLRDWAMKDQEDARALITALLMKAADISNVARPIEISMHWARVLMSEFARQGELEAELAMETCLFGGPPKKDDDLAAAQSQKGFMDLFGLPLFREMTAILPGVACATNELEGNHKIWIEKIAKEKSRRNTTGEESPVVLGRVSKDQVEEAQDRHKSDPTAVPERIGLSPTGPVSREPVTEIGGASQAHPASKMLAKNLHPLLDDGEQDDESTLGPLHNTRPISPPIGTSSRRSSKDVALEQFQQLSSYATTQGLVRGPGSRRGSADAGWQLHQSYTGSRRGSKDESLTTILFTSQSSPGRRESPSSLSQTNRSTPTPHKALPVRGDIRDETRMSRLEDARTPANSQGSTVGCSEDARIRTELTASNVDLRQDSAHVENTTSSQSSTSGHRRAYSGSTAETTSVPSLPQNKPDSPNMVARVTSADSRDAVQTNERKSGRIMRESRSRSRLRGLKFWRKKRDASDADQENRVDSSSRQ